MSQQIPPLPDEVFLDAGAAAVLRELPFLTRRQARAFFERVWKPAEVARDLARDELLAWMRREERRRERGAPPPPPPQPSVSIDGISAFTILGLKPGALDRAEIQKAWRREAAKHHPDRGGREDVMAMINRARDALLKVAA